MVLAHPVYPIKFILFLGAVMMGMQGLSMLCKTIIKLKKGK
jgi:TRAP-type mannitol/chloroaromatic compound transport system permease small subunit